MIETKPFRAEEYLDSEEKIAAYLDEAANYPELAADAVETVALARELNAKRGPQND
jgi:DNA-binding phage protein